MEFGTVSPELVAAIESIAEAHADCSTVAPVAADESLTAPAVAPETYMPAEAHLAPSAFIATTEESPMKDIKATLKGIPVLQYRRSGGRRTVAGSFVVLLSGLMYAIVQLPSLQHVTKR